LILKLKEQKKRVEMNRITKSWDEFQKVGIPPSAGADQVMDMKTAFLAGMESYFLATMDILDEGKTEIDEEKMFAKLQEDMKSELKKMVEYHKNR